MVHVAICSIVEQFCLMFACGVVRVVGGRFIADHCLLTFHLQAIAQILILFFRYSSVKVN